MEQNLENSNLIDKITVLRLEICTIQGWIQWVKLRGGGNFSNIW